MAGIVAAFPMGGVALDVGTWYGPWTYWLSRRAAHVHSFEPNPDVAPRCSSTPSAANVTVRRMAGLATTRAPRRSRSRSGARAPRAGRRWKACPRAPAAVEVPTIRLDDLGIEGVTLHEGRRRGPRAGCARRAAEMLAASHPLLVVELEERHGGIAPAVDLLAGLGLPRARSWSTDAWTSLDDFDLAAHQERYLVEHGSATYLQSTFRGGATYINNVVFTHLQTSLGTWLTD